MLMQGHGDMDFSVYKRIIDQFPNGKLEYLTLGGWGEPFLNSRILDFINYAAQKGVKVQVTSNASLLTEEKIGAVLESGLSTLCFSVDACNKESLAVLRPNSERFDVLGNIERFVKENEKRRKKVKVGILFLLNRYNLGSLEACIEWGKSLGVNFILVSGVHLQYPGMNTDGYEISEEERERIIKQLTPAYSVIATSSVVRFLNIYNLSFVKNVLKKFTSITQNLVRVLFLKWTNRLVDAVLTLKVLFLFHGKVRYIHVVVMLYINSICWQTTLIIFLMYGRVSI
jgi:MoaA/NifB/PqqE/SkfB family radical SAM enzyme